MFCVRRSFIPGSTPHPSIPCWSSCRSYNPRRHVSYHTRYVYAQIMQNTRCTYILTVVRRVPFIIMFLFLLFLFSQRNDVGLGGVREPTCKRTPHVHRVWSLHSEFRAGVRVGRTYPSINTSKNTAAFRDSARHGKFVAVVVPIPVVWNTRIYIHTYMVKCTSRDHIINECNHAIHTRPYLLFAQQTVSRQRNIPNDRHLLAVEHYFITAT